MWIGTSEGAEEEGELEGCLLLLLLLLALFFKESGEDREEEGRGRVTRSHP